MYTIREAIQSRKKRISSVAVILFITMLLFLYNWTWEAIDMAHLPPTAKRCNIYSWVRQRKLAKPQLRVISKQTGLSMASVEALLEQGYIVEDFCDEEYESQIIANLA